MFTYRCPVDDCTFVAKNEPRVPTLEGHPECPGPACEETFKNYTPGAKRPAPATAPASPAPAPVVAASQPGSGASSPLAPPPVGQGW